MNKLIAFVPTVDATRSRLFYEGSLGLKFVSDNEFVTNLESEGVSVMLQKVQNFTPQQFTLLGWEVSDITKRIKELTDNGIKFERFEGIVQDELGVMTFPGGTKVAWFKDPDGNTLSLTTF